MVATGKDIYNILNANGFWLKWTQNAVSCIGFSSQHLCVLITPTKHLRLINQKYSLIHEDHGVVVSTEKFLNRLIEDSLSDWCWFFNWFHHITICVPVDAPSKYFSPWWMCCCGMTISSRYHIYSMRKWYQSGNLIRQIRNGSTKNADIIAPTAINLFLFLI